MKAKRQGSRLLTLAVAAYLMSGGGIAGATDYNTTVTTVGTGDIGTITVSGDGEQKGISLAGDGAVTFTSNGNTPNLTVTSNNNTAYGIYGGNTTTINGNVNMVINGADSIGVYAGDGKTVALKGNTSIVAKTVLNPSHNATINVGTDDGTTLNGKTVALTGMMAGNGTVNLCLGTGSTWYTTGASSFGGTLNVIMNGGIIDTVAKSNGYRSSIQINNWSGTGYYYTGGTVATYDNVTLFEPSSLTINNIVNGSVIKIGVCSLDGKTFTGSDAVLYNSSLNANSVGTTVVAVPYTYGSKTYKAELAYNADAGGIIVKSFGSTSQVNENTITMADAKYALNDLWLAETNNLQKRMGDLRATKPAETGAWIRYGHGELKAGTGSETRMKYNMMQGGYDVDRQVKDGTFYRGGALSYAKGSTNFGNGSGDLKEATFSLYQTWVGKSGHYYDIILKTGRYMNDYNALLNNNQTVSHGDYSTWAYSVSGEYGYRQQLGGGLYVEPQAELILGHVNGADYTVQGAKADLKATNHCITRLGAAYGKEFANGSTLFGRASWFHEFGGSMSVALDDTSYSRDPARNWFELELGGSLKAADNCNIYSSLGKDLGDVKSDLKVDVGARWSF